MPDVNALIDELETAVSRSYPEYQVLALIRDLRRAVSGDPAPVPVAAPAPEEEKPSVEWTTSPTGRATAKGRGPRKPVEMRPQGAVVTDEGREFG